MNLVEVSWIVGASMSESIAVEFHEWGRVCGVLDEDGDVLGAELLLEGIVHHVNLDIAPQQRQAVEFVNPEGYLYLGRTEFELAEQV